MFFPSKYFFLGSNLDFHDFPTEHLQMEITQLFIVSSESILNISILEYCSFTHAGQGVGVSAKNKQHFTLKNNNKLKQYLE